MEAKNFSEIEKEFGPFQKVEEVKLPKTIEFTAAIQEWTHVKFIRSWFGCGVVVGYRRSPGG